MTDWVQVSGDRGRRFISVLPESSEEFETCVIVMYPLSKGSNDKRNNGDNDNSDDITDIRVLMTFALGCSWRSVTADIVMCHRT